MNLEDQSRHRRARELVLRYGWNTTVYQILNPGIDHWFSKGGEAVVGYLRRMGTRVVAGAPVCDEGKLPEVVAEFERDAKLAGDTVCYFGAEARLERLFRGSPRHTVVPIGKSPSWHPGLWAARVGRCAKVRAQLNRARNKGVVVREWSSRRAERHRSLERCLAHWLGNRGLPPLHFLVEPDTLSRLSDRRIFVAERENGPVGYLVASPIPTRRGWLVEQVVRGPSCPNGTAELLIDAAANQTGRDQAQFFTLGMAPLLSSNDDEREVPWWIRGLFVGLRSHAQRFYNFNGLAAFKTKFSPSQWDPVYLASKEPRLSPASLMAAALAFSGTRVPRFASGAVKRIVTRWANYR